MNKPAVLRKLWRHGGVRLGVWLVGLLCVVFGLSVITVYERTYHTCLHCRADRYSRWLLGFRWSSVSDTEFTPWYLAHYPAHEHAWVWSGCTVGKSIFGTPTYFASGRRHPVHELPSSWELLLAERAPAQFAAFYQGIVATDKAEQERVAREAFQVAVKLELDGMRNHALPRKSLPQ